MAALCGGAWRADWTCGARGGDPRDEHRLAGARTLAPNCHAASLPLTGAILRALRVCTRQDRRRICRTRRSTLAWRRVESLREALAASPGFKRDRELHRGGGDHPRMARYGPQRCRDRARRSSPTACRPRRTGHAPWPSVNAWKAAPPRWQVRGALPSHRRAAARQDRSARASSMSQAHTSPQPRRSVDRHTRACELNATPSRRAVGSAGLARPSRSHLSRVREAAPVTALRTAPHPVWRFTTSAVRSSGGP